MDRIPDVDWASLELDWEIPTHNYTTEDFRRMSGVERLAVSARLTQEGMRRWKAALWRQFPDATPEQMREIIIRIRVAESEKERQIAERGEACYRARRQAEC